MQEEKKVKMELTEAEVALLNKARQDEAKRQAELKKKADTDAYKALVDKAINETVNEALELSQLMSTKKEGIMTALRPSSILRKTFSKVRNSKTVAILTVSLMETVPPVLALVTTPMMRMMTPTPPVLTWCMSTSKASQAMIRAANWLTW